MWQQRHPDLAKRTRRRRLNGHRQPHFAHRGQGRGTGENGNGVNVFRAGSVFVSGYSAIRGNAASNIQSCQRLGQVALYAEFGFECALIADLIDTAATSISVTNFDEGWASCKAT